MLQAEDLRVGNWVNDKKHGHIRVHTINGGTGQVCGLSKDIDLDRFVKDGEKALAEKGEFVFDGSSKYNTVLLENIEPIMLTPEILEKCGFENVQWGGNAVGYKFIKKIDNFCLEFWIEYTTYSSKSNFIINNGCENKINLSDKVKYLHQLQNLCYALTQKELGIKTPSYTHFY